MYIYICFSQTLIKIFLLHAVFITSRYVKTA